jgi:DNA-binding SARP family transcriptional activator
VLRHDPAGFQLVVAPAAVDSRQFEQLAGEAAELRAGGRAGEAVQRAEEALALWRGRPYAAVADEPWAAAAVGRLEELHGQLRERLVEALLAAGEPQRALVELDAPIAETPLRERLWALRMLAEHRSGHPDRALRTFEQAREVLLDALGLEPGAELRELHAQLVDGAPAPAADPGPGEVRLPHGCPCWSGAPTSWPSSPTGSAPDRS